jgi:hypothetical protein
MGWDQGRNGCGGEHNAIYSLARLGIGGADKWGECWFRGWEEGREDNGTTVVVLEKEDQLW